MAPADELTKIVWDNSAAGMPASAPVTTMTGRAVQRTDTPDTAAPSEFCIMARISSPSRRCLNHSSTRPSSTTVQQRPLITT